MICIICLKIANRKKKKKKKRFKPIIMWTSLCNVFPMFSHNIWWKQEYKGLLTRWIFGIMQLLNHSPVIQNFTKVLTNVTLKFLSWYGKYIDIFAEKMWVAFALQKLLTFLQQTICIWIWKYLSYITHFVINEFIKLTMLWTTGPRFPMYIYHLLQLFLAT